MKYKWFVLKFSTSTHMQVLIKRLQWRTVKFRLLLFSNCQPMKHETTYPIEWTRRPPPLPTSGPTAPSRRPTAWRWEWACRSTGPTCRRATGRRPRTSHGPRSFAPVRLRHRPLPDRPTCGWTPWLRTPASSCRWPSPDGPPDAPAPAWRTSRSSWTRTSSTWPTFGDSDENAILTIAIPMVRKYQCCCDGIK